MTKRNIENIENRGEKGENGRIIGTRHIGIFDYVFGWCR